MYVAIACKSHNYCLKTFHTTHAAFCSRNNIIETSLPDPTSKMIDDLAAGNPYTTQEDIPASPSLPSDVQPAVEESESSLVPDPTNASDFSSPRESPILPSAVQPDVVESSSSQHPETDPKVTTPQEDSPNLPSVVPPAEVESSASQHPTNDPKVTEPEVHNPSSDSQITAKDFPGVSTPEFIKFFATHHKEFDLQELAEEISNIQTIKPIASLKQAFITLSGNSYKEYLAFLVYLGNFNKDKLNGARLEKVYQQMEILSEGISLRLAENNPECCIYGKSKASLFDILLEVEHSTAIINRSYKKIRSALFKALWAGLINLHEISLIWETST